MANINGSLFFTANDGIHGFQTWIVPADQIEDLKDHGRGEHHELGEHDEGGEPSLRPAALGDRGAAPAPASSAGESALGSLATPNGNNPTSAPARVKAVVLRALIGGPLGLIRSRVLQAPAGSQRVSGGSLVELRIGPSS
jgi:hypothetical protein